MAFSFFLFCPHYLVYLWVTECFHHLREVCCSSQWIWPCFQSLFPAVGIGRLKDTSTSYLRTIVWPCLSSLCVKGHKEDFLALVNSHLAPLILPGQLSGSSSTDYPVVFVETGKDWISLIHFKWNHQPFDESIDFLSLEHPPVNSNGESWLSHFHPYPALIWDSWRLHSAFSFTGRVVWRWFSWLALTVLPEVKTVAVLKFTLT